MARRPALGAVAPLPTRRAAPSLAAARPAWRTVVVAWAAGRAVVLAAAVLLSLALGEPERGVDPSVPPWAALLGGWDTTWYLDIARNGYAEDTGPVGEEYTNLAFFPLVPAVMAAGAAAGLNPFLTALAVSNLAFLAALLGLHALTGRRFGATVARRSVWALSLAPPALVASLAYTEGPTLAVVIGAAYLATRGRWALAGLLAALAPLLRSPGVLVVVLLAGLALADGAPGRARRLALAAGPPLLALGGFLAWMQLARGSWSLPFEAQRAWDGRPLIGFVTTAHTWLPAWGDALALRPGGTWAASVRDLLFGAIFVVLLAALWRREGGLRSPWVAYSAACLALPFTTFGPVAAARYGVVAFPLVWPVATWLEGTPRRRHVVAACAVGVTLLMLALLSLRSP